MSKEYQTHVVDESNIKDWRTELPNSVVKGSKSDISVYAKWLYVYLKSVAGESGKCWQSTTTLAKGSGISSGKVSQCKKELEQEGLISIEKGDVKKGNSDTIRIKDIWASNILEFQKKHTPSRDERPPSPHEHPHSHDEHTPSRDESKKNPIKNNPNKETTRESFTERLDSAETKQELLDLWIEYRKSKNKHAGLQEQDIILNRDWKGKGVDEIRESIAYTVKNGWLTLQWEEKDEQQPQMSYHQEI